GKNPTPGNAVKNLREEATCAVCLDFFRRPVMLLPCGHNFCRSCVTRCAQKSQDGAGSCPLCRLPFPPGGFCPNRQLANVVAAVRELVEGEDLGLGGDLERRLPSPSPNCLPQKNAWRRENCPLPPQIPPKKMTQTPNPFVPPASVTLDPATAHPQILVSPDGRSARRCKTPRDPPPGSSERFEALRCVLGRQGFAAGRHRWAVEVSPGPDWALGVAREFVPRKGCFGLSPARGVWAVGQWLGQLRALTWPSPTCLHLARVPKRIEVALDYGGGRVAFRDADSEVEIFAFPPAAFAGERLRPLLWLGEGPALLTFCP
uniref:Uncharacterized protein n=1 Tax=Anas zonorhyncha TaxID=75864 RepID=A0A8B9VEG1_9AVES